MRSTAGPATLLGVWTVVLGVGLTPAIAYGATLEDAQRHFYSARYVEAAAEAQALLAEHPDDLAAYELRTAALHFQLRRLLGDAKDKEAALAGCADCAPVLTAFMDDFRRSRDLAVARLVQTPAEEETLFLLGKIDLNYIWLQLSTLGRRTGWNEFREARRSLDAVLDKNPMHVRARVARAWVDYIVGTRVPWGTRWLMGGGSRSRGLRSVREAAKTKADYFVEVEASFALQEMLTREGRFDEAVGVAKDLLLKFPENKDLARFVEQDGRR